MPPGPPVGLAGEDRAVFAARVLGAWDAFLDLAEAADLAAPSRLPGWSGADICIHLGAWPGYSAVRGIVANARAGGTGRPRLADDENARVLAAHRHAGRDEVLAGLVLARDEVEELLDGSEADELGLAPAMSPVGRLPVLTVVGAGSYELAVHALDLLPCAAPEPPVELLLAGLGAVCDVTAALASGVGIDAVVTAQSPDGGWRFTSTPGRGWTTEATPAGPVPGTAVLADAAVLLDVSAGRTAVPPLLVSGRLRVQQMGSFLRLAPIVEAVPGLPGGPALRLAARSVGTVGRWVHRLPTRRR
jgi:hypothetical protein